MLTVYQRVSDILEDGPSCTQIKCVLEMDIVKGNLDDISRPSSVSRSRPGSRISSSLPVEKPKIFSNVGSLEVLTPEKCFSQILTLHDGQENLKYQSPESSLEVQSSQNSTVFTLNSRQEKVNEKVKSREAEESDSSELPVDPEHDIDPRLEKAIKRMKTLDEILLKKIAKEKEVVAQSIAIRKQLWQELQSVSKYSLSRSHEENVNTNKFLALTSQLTTPTGENSAFEKEFLPVFFTQPPLEECDDNGPKALQGNVSGRETSDILNSNETLHQNTKQKKCKDHKGGANFIQRNIELVKEVGCHVLFVDEEKLRLEQLLADIQDDCNDDNVTTVVSVWLIPGEGYTAEPGERTQLANIEAQLQMFCSTTGTSDGGNGVSPKHLKSEVSLDNFENSVSAPGEQVLRYTKELREQKIRLQEINQQLENIQRSSTTPISSCFSSLLSE